MESVLTESEMMADLVDFLGGVNELPDPAEGWFTIVDMMKASGRSYNSVVYRLKKAIGENEMERKMYGRFAYYRLIRNDE